MIKIILLLSVFLLSFGNTYAGMCFPKHIVYTIEGEQKYTRFNGLMDNAFGFPLFNINKPQEIGFSYTKGWESCGSIDISNKNRLIVTDFGFKDGLLLSINILIVLFIYFAPIYYFTKFTSRQNNHITIRLFVIISFLFFWSIPYFLFYIRL